jgi:ubiquinone/menaquinone biosynthesis C-methylase UbiE
VKRLRERYVGPVAEEYESRRMGAQWGWENMMLASELDRHEPRAVLDVPCGTGRFWPLYRHRGVHATGVDLSGDMLAQARRRGWADVARGSIFDLPFLAESFDLVVCFRLLNWMTRDECVAALHELGRVSDRLVASIGLGSGMQGRTRLQDRGVFSDAGWRVTASHAGEGHPYYRIVACER